MRESEMFTMRAANYQKLMEQEIERNAAFGRVPRLLLHVCCAPCSSAVLSVLCGHFDVTCFDYNPNISPKEEFDKRAKELSRLIDEMPLPGARPRVLVGAYDAPVFEALAQGLENLPEGGERCFRCYRLRLEETARRARDEGFDYFTTTLSVSPYKNAAKLNELGGELAARYGVPYLFSDFKKCDGYLRSIRLSKQYGLYRQNYCGCVYSKRQAEQKQAASASRADG